VWGEKSEGGGPLHSVQYSIPRVSSVLRTNHGHASSSRKKDSYPAATVGKPSCAFMVQRHRTAGCWSACGFMWLHVGSGLRRQANRDLVGILVSPSRYQLGTPHTIQHLWHRYLFRLPRLLSAALTLDMMAILVGSSWILLLP
jgi:hypothetical protein